MMHGGEYGRAISLLEGEVSNEGRSPEEKTDCCLWLAECHQRVDDQKSAGDWYLEAVKRILNQKLDNKLKAEKALPLCDKAMECYKAGGDAADVLMTARLRQYFLGLK